MKKRIVALMIAPIIGAGLGYVLVTALMNGWFSSRWQEIEKPPVVALHLLALNTDSLLIQGDSGAIYYNKNASTCKSDCWIQVPDITALPTPVEQTETTVTSEACTPPPPLSRVKESISECRRTMWVDYNSTFALRQDGKIYLWQVELYKEWSVVLFFSGICTGALVLFVPALVIVLFLGFLDWRSKRANKNSGSEVI